MRRSVKPSLLWVWRPARQGALPATAVRVVPEIINSSQPPMNIRTSNNNDYSYLRRTNEIVGGVVDESLPAWEFEPLKLFGSLPNLELFIIGITEQCNLRCTYCCYSGSYKGNRTHGTLSMSTDDIDRTLAFIGQNAKGERFHITFYGGEPLANYDVLCYSITKAETIWNEAVTFSITTNGTLLCEERIEWLIEHRVDLHLSIDGTKEFHDRNRVDAAGNGSFGKVYKALEYIRNTHEEYMPYVQIQMTIPSFDEIADIAESWHGDKLLKKIQPTRISALAPNFSIGVPTLDFEEMKSFYGHLLSIYETHRDWMVLKAFLFQQIAYWKDRPIVEADGGVPMSTCLPVTNKLFIDDKGEIAVCEKFSDDYRIGDITQGIDWEKANEYVQTYYNKRVHRCSRCPAVRMCDLCLTAVEFNDDQWDILCHNERVHQQATFWLFCEMAERGMLLDTAFQELDTSRCKLSAVCEDNIPAFRAILADETTQKFLPELCDVAKTDDGIRQFIKSFDAYQRSGGGILWGIRQNECLAGFVAIMDIPENPTIFYAMDARYRGKGIMTECVVEVVGWFKKTHPALSLQTEVYKENIASVKLLEHNGFRQCGEDNNKVYLKLLNL